MFADPGPVCLNGGLVRFSYTHKFHVKHQGDIRGIAFKRLPQQFCAFPGKGHGNGSLLAFHERGFAHGNGSDQGLLILLKGSDQGKASLTINNRSFNTGIGLLFFKPSLSGCHPILAGSIGHQEMDNTTPLGNIGTGFSGFLGTAVFHERKLGLAIFHGKPWLIRQIVPDGRVFQRLVANKISDFFHLVQVDLLTIRRPCKDACQDQNKNACKKFNP